MVGAEAGIGERRQREDREPRKQQRPRRAAPRRKRGERTERDREIIGVALLEAERTGQDLQDELEEPGARDRRRRDQGDGQRGGQRGAARSRFKRGYCGTLGRHGSLFGWVVALSPNPGPCGCRERPGSLWRGLTPSFPCL